ncbi:MAG: CDP-alcohol phosphatidyltransferase family protein [Frankiaceae bacterium]
MAARAAARADAPVGDRVWTVPNLLSIARLVGVPVFLWLLLGPRSGWADWAALGVLMLSGITDYLDGKLARAWGQTSRLGQLLDPAADRLYVVATIAAFTIRGIIPLVLTAVLVARELFLAALLPVLRRHGYGPLAVNYVGKAATLCLLYAFPLLLLGTRSGALGDVTRVIGWSFTVWGTALYWVAGAVYAVQVRRLTRAAPVIGRPPDPAPVAPPGGAGKSGTVTGAREVGR